MKTLLTTLIMTTLLSINTETEATVLEVVIYKIKKDHVHNFEEVLLQVRSAIEEFPGFVEYQTLRSMTGDLRFIDIVKWESMDAAQAASKKVEQMKEFAPFMAAFEEILIMDHFELFTGQATNGETKPDLTHTDKAYYTAGTEPRIIELPPANYLSVNGVSSPENPQFLSAIEAIYAVANSLKSTSKDGERDFVIAKMEAQWWVESGLSFEATPRDEWHWNILIRLPKFITPCQVDDAVQSVIRAGGMAVASEVTFTSLHEGKSVQALHIGSYEEEGPTLEKIRNFLQDQNFEINGHHHEIYISDPSNTPVEELKTIIRYPVK